MTKKKEWEFYNENGIEVVVDFDQLKWLSRNGFITQDTILYNTESKFVSAGKVKGLAFAKPVPQEEIQLMRLFWQEKLEEDEALDGPGKPPVYEYQTLIFVIESLNIKGLPPKPRGKGEKIDLKTFFQALRYKAKTGCAWCDLPAKFGNWKSIQSRFLDWRKAGVFELIEEEICRNFWNLELPWIGLKTSPRPGKQADSAAQE